MSDHTAHLARAIWGASAAFLLASCATVEVGSDYDRSVTFATYHTFTLIQREHPEVPNPLLATHVREDITQVLLRRGYTLAADPADADFTVDFTVGSRERLDINSYPAAFAGPVWWGSNLDVRQYNEGTLAINVFDGRTHRPVWYGWTKKELTNKDIEQPAGPVSEAVSSVLAKFPPA